MKKKRWLCLFTVMLVGLLLSLSVSAAPSTDKPGTDKNQYRGTVDQIYLAIHDQEGEWPAEPSIADHAYLFLKKSGNTVTSGGSGSVQFDTKASTYINTKTFQDLYRSSVKTSGSDGGKVTGLSKPTGMDGTEGFWTKDGFRALTNLKNDIIRVYLQNRTSGTKIKNPTAAQIAEYDVLIYVVKYEEYYTGSGEIHTGNSGYHVDCAVVKKTSVKLIYDANLPDGYAMTSGVGLPNNKTVAQNTKGVVLDALSYLNNAHKGQEIENDAGQTGAFLGWSLDKETVVSSVDLGTTDVTVYALWRTEEAQKTVSVHYDANLPDGFSLADGVTLPGSKTVAQNTSGVSLDTLQYAEGLTAGNEIHNGNGRNGTFLGWSLSASSTNAVTSIDVGTTDVTLYALWRVEEEEPEQPGSLSVQKTVKSVGGAAVTQDDDGNLVIPTAYPGYEILWEITVTNSGSKEASFTLTDALLEQGAKVYDADGNPVIVSGTLWTGTVAANGSCTYTVRYTLQKEDLSAGGLINTVVLDEEEIPAEPVSTSAYPVYVYFKTLLVNADGAEEAIQLSNVTYNDAASGSWATLGWISDLLTEQPADSYSETSYDSGFQVAKSAVSSGSLTAYGDNGAWLDFVQWDELIASHGANGLGDTEIVTEPEGRLAWHLNGSVRVCQLTYDGNAADASSVPENSYLIKDATSQISDEAPYRAGYVFTGWNTKPDGTGDSYAVGSSITLSVSDTLYAQWEETTASFDLNDMGGSAVIKKHLGGEPASTYAETFAVMLTPVEQEAKPLNAEAQTGTSITGYAAISADTLTAGFLFAEDARILTFEAAGTYFYQVQEVSGSNSRVTYDDSVYMLVITVSQTDDGVLKISDWQFLLEGKEALGAYLTITNTYSAPSGGGGGGTRPPVIIKSTVKDYLNTEDHFAYIVGYSDGTVRPNSSITRAEVATIFFRLLNEDVRDKNLTSSNSFSDVKRGDWYNTAISTMAALGILDGYSDGTFRPNEPITRAEFAAIAARFDENAASGSASFSDLSGHWAASEISKAYKNGWVTGYSDGTFRPDQSITRAEAVTLINRVLERELPDDAELLDEMNVWSDNRDTGKWYYLDIQEATNSHAYTRDKKDNESWVKMRTDPDWTSYED